MSIPSSTLMDPLWKETLEALLITTHEPPSSSPTDGLSVPKY